MSPVFSNLDDICNQEGCDIGRIGDHTMRQWEAHGSTKREMLEYEDVQDVVRAKIGGLDGYIISDGLIAKSAVADLADGQRQVHLPIMLFEFNVGRPGQAPATVAKVAYLGSPEIMRDMARLLGDTARGAANAAERQGGQR